ncbi:MAG TPA: hypothetical protein VN426_03705 [Syntrophomonadaceae bacterium]|nr:hypothetical protein [Syntrophomonadaceae bacterium]
MKWSRWCGNSALKKSLSRGGESGLVLLEILLVLPMMILLAALLFMLLWTGMRGFDRLVMMEEQQYFARTAMQAISDDIIQANSVSLFNDGQGLDMKDPDGRSIRYYLAGNQIYRISGTNSVPITENTSICFFSYLSANVVQVEIVEGQGANTFRLLEACHART